MINQGKSYEFFLSELFEEDDVEVGYIIEMMRAANHIREVIEILFYMGPPEDSDEWEEEVFNAEMESKHILLYNLHASHLREALKLYGKFMKLPFYSELIKSFNLNQKKIANELEKYVNEFDEKKGVLYDVLIPLRNSIFHYDHKEALKWVKDKMDEEKDEKPNHHYISLEKKEFGPGLEYNNELFSKYVFGRIMDIHLPEIIELNNLFLEYVAAMSEVLLSQAGIPDDRERGWFMKYMYGFKREK